METQCPQDEVHTLQRPRTRSRVEAHKQLSLTILHASSSKAKAQEVELRTRMIAAPTAVLAVHHPCFLGVQCQLTLRESFTDGFQEPLRLFFRAAMTDHIIGVPFKWYAGIMRLHPRIKSVV
jgi:hypothetical protein